MSENLNHRYSDKEERLNVLTHGFGMFMSVIGLFFLISKSFAYSGFWNRASFVIYGVSMIVLYAASTFYHAAKKPSLRRKLNIFDHAAIYVLIAGSYSPFCIVVLNNDFGWYMFLFVWTCALLGVILKLFFTGRFDKISTFLYLLMGWQVMFFIKPIMNNLPLEGLYYLMAGGVAYTLGAILYSISRIPYNHAIFHVFVLFGSFFHFMTIFFYI